MYLFGQFPADAGNFRQLLDAGAPYAGQSAKAGNQGLAPGRADAGQAIQRRGFAAFRALPAVAGNGEAVCFVAHFLNQVQGRMEGSVEVISFGCGGNDFAAARPPQRGWAALRFPVGDLDAFAGAMAAAGCDVSGVETFEWAPYGGVEAVAAITPWGARFEALRLF